MKLFFVRLLLLPLAVVLLAVAMLAICAAGILAYWDVIVCGLGIWLLVRWIVKRQKGA